MWPFKVICLVLFYTCFSSAKEKCCDEMTGCFTDDYPFDHLPLPNCLEDINPTFTLFKVSDQDDGMSITRNSIPTSWDPYVRTIFVAHGWVQSDNAPWMQDIKREYLKKGDFNVILLDWRRGSRVINYYQAAADIRMLGKEIAIIANLLLDNGTTPDLLYCIGHSLGAHMCGHAGLDTHLGRITGLDPAGPLFEDYDLESGLNPSRADLVDVIHTHGEPNVIINLGTLRKLGHVDFYPNGGGQQPGCILDPKKKKRDVDADHDHVQGVYVDENRVPTTYGGADWMPVCSHLRASPLYIESINSDCKFTTPEMCYDNYNIPESCISCGSSCQVMGFDADLHTARGIFYLETNSKEPYCRG